MTGDKAAARRMFRYEVPVDDRPHPVRLSGSPVAAACTITGRTALVEFYEPGFPGGDPRVHS